MRARAELGDELPALHRRAAHWYAEQRRGGARRSVTRSRRRTGISRPSARRQHWFDLFVRGESARFGARRRPACRPAEGDAELAAAIACTAFEAGDAEAARRHLERARWPRSPGCRRRRRRAYLETMALARLYLARRDCDFDAALAAADTLLPRRPSLAGGPTTPGARSCTRRWARPRSGRTARPRADRARGGDRPCACDRPRLRPVAALSHLAMIDYLARGTERDRHRRGGGRAGRAARLVRDPADRVRARHARRGRPALSSCAPTLAEEHVARGCRPSRTPTRGRHRLRARPT